MTLATQDMGATETHTGPLSEDDAGEAFLRSFLPPDEGDDASKKPSSEKDTEDTKSDTSEAETDDKAPAEKPEAEGEGDGPEADAEEDEGDTVLVKVKVGDEEHEVPVSKLARLYGQEAALTKKSMEVAEQRKAYDSKLQEQAAATALLLERAQKRFEPYQSIDFNLLSASVAQGQLTAEEYTNLRKAAQAAWEDVQFLETNTADFVKKIGDDRAAATQAQAQEALKVLSGPVEKGGLEGWSQKLYDDIRAFAVSQGAPSEMINSVTDPWAIRMMHSAMLFARGQQKSKSDVKVTKVNKTPTRIVKTTTSPAASKASNAGAADKALAQLKRSGSTEDAENAFLARWQSD